MYSMCIEYISICILCTSINCSSAIKLLCKILLNLSTAEFRIDYKGTNPEGKKSDTRLL